jgi:F-type H+-transporting ATPase subunit gamma
MTQVTTETRLVPAPLPEGALETKDTGGAQAIYEFEPDEETILAKLLPQALAIQMYRALLESAAGEHAARMTAMDNATRNAGDMIKRLTQNYNRARQANITKELIEIISGAEAV